MKFNTKVMIIVSFLFVACNRIESSIIKFKQETVNHNFPVDWLGCWEGNLQIFNSTGKTQEIPMSLEILPIQNNKDVHQWNIIYGEDRTKGKRAYFLKSIDASKGHYIIDEDNGIVLDAYLFGNSFASTYEVVNNLIDVKYTLENNYISFDIVMSTTKNINITGDTIINNDTIPMVKSYFTKIVQKAKLNKKPCPIDH